MSGRWVLYQSEPRVVTQPLKDAARTKSDAGLYDYDGKTWYLRGHDHADASCVHKFKVDRWVLED